MTVMNTRLLVLGVVVAVALGACGDDAFSPEDEGPTGSTYAPGGTGTVPIPGPADWLEWSPAESPDAASEAELVAALDELGMAMVIPASAPPTGGTASALFNSQSLGWGSGETFPNTTEISLNVQVGGATIVLITDSGGSISCPDGFMALTFRGDAEACAGEDIGHGAVRWREAGQSFQASFLEGLSLDQGLAWLGTWRLLP
jgi:hypothetical protein